MAISRKECERKIETEPNLCNFSSTAAAASSNMILSQASDEKIENTANGKEPKSPKGLDLVMCMRLSQIIVMCIFQQSLTKSVM